MTKVELVAKLDKHFRQFIATLPPYIPIKLYSAGRRWFLGQFFQDVPKKDIQIPNEFSRKIWGLTFQSPIFNAAGIFKESYGYEVVRRQGAGAFLIGTVTPKPRAGNSKNGYYLPFLPLPKSKAALNWLGLPNLGLEEIAKRIQKIEKKSNCPLGVSISSDPLDSEVAAINNLVAGFKMFEKTQVDFIELNESCPNVPHNVSEHYNGVLDPKLIARLEQLSNSFLKYRTRRLPVIVKFSVDITIQQVEAIIPILIDLQYDGINLGNTSTNYSLYKNMLDLSEQKNFEYFIKTFGGGFSGFPLKNTSLNISTKAVNTLKKMNSGTEFTVIRTGGIEKLSDIQQSESSGIKLNQWFTGYFDNFAKFGHKVYQEFFNNNF
jgi:dihydroorotate dehydrogenase